MTKNPNIEFEILIDEAFANINTNKDLESIENKKSIEFSK